MALPLAYNLSLNGRGIENKLGNNLFVVQSMETAKILNLEGHTLCSTDITESKHN